VKILARVVFNTAPNNSFNRSADTRLVINTHRSVRPVNSGDAGSNVHSHGAIASFAQLVHIGE